MAEQIGQRNKLKPYENLIYKKFSTYKLMLYFGLGSISILFLALTLTYFFSKSFEPEGTSPLRFPPLFYVNSLLILASTLSIHFASRAHDQDDHETFANSILASGILGLLFLIGQCAAWFLMREEGFGLTQHSSASYLYVISGLHAFHLVGGVFFIFYYIGKFRGLLSDGATALVFFTDPVPKLQLNLLEIYWHFLTVLWFYLFFFFLLIR